MQQRFLLGLLEEGKARELLPAGKEPRELPRGCTQRVGDGNTHMSSWASAVPAVNSWRVLSQDTSQPHTPSSSLLLSILPGNSGWAVVSALLSPADNPAGNSAGQQRSSGCSKPRQGAAARSTAGKAEDAGDAGSAMATSPAGAGWARMPIKI